MLPGRSGLQCLFGTVGFQRLLINDLDPSAVGDDDPFVSEPSQIARCVYTGDGEDLRNIFLGQVNATALISGRISGKEVEEIAQLDERIVIILMCAFIQEQIDISCMPVQGTEHQILIFTEHIQECLIGKAESFHVGDRRGGDRMLYLEGGPVASGENSAAAVERTDLAGAVFVFQSGQGDAGYDVMDMGYSLAAVPQAFVFAKCLWGVGTGEKVFVEVFIVSGETVAGDQHD